MGNAQVLMERIALSGLVRSIPTTIMLNICTPLPDMYSIKAFMGTDLAGAIATSHAFFCFRDSTSDAVGPARAVAALLERCEKGHQSGGLGVSLPVSLPVRLLTLEGGPAALV